MKILIDTREKKPFTFISNDLYCDTETELRTLPTGDYSIDGYQDSLAIERKTLPDLVTCLGKERNRFERELQRAENLQFFAVIIEAKYTALKKGYYQSHISPHAACQSIAAFHVKYGIPFLFCDSRPAAEYECWSLLNQFFKHQQSPQQL